MNLYEYQAKQILAKYNLPIPQGYLCSNLNDIVKCISQIKGPWVGKCQIQSGGRGQSGGVKILKTKDEVQSFVTHWLGKRLITYQTDDNGEIVNNILIEPCLNIVHELYFSMSISRKDASIICLVSNQGGMEIEKIIKNKPNLIYECFLNPLLGPQIYQARKLGFDLKLNNNQLKQFISIFINLGKIFLKHDLTLIEINPLIITNNDNLLCLDAKIIIDDNALFRQEKIFLTNNISQNKSNTSLHISDNSSKFNYVPMKGNIGCIVNGAGLAMATMDLLSLYGGTVANFLDIGGDVTKESFIEAIKIIAYNHTVKVIFVNVFGGIVCCNLIAEGIIAALSVLHVTLPIVVRFKGNNAILGSSKLVNSKYYIIANDNLFDSIQKVVFIANK